jgi:dienelactone hydrolase
MKAHGQTPMKTPRRPPAFEAGRCRFYPGICSNSPAAADTMVRMTRTIRLAVQLFPLLAAAVAMAAEPGFRQHAIDRQATFSAAAAIDVNHDGRLDVVTGGSWYEAPDWQRHPVRDVEFIRGRYDDYACLPLDVNGDGQTDFITANYRSEKLAWIENPGKAAGAWMEHVIERPGPMETGRLADINGDGRLDVLPAGKNFCAWWQLSNAPGEAPKWLRHDLPHEAAGHGIGFGDVNGDDRGDVVAAGGWLEAPADRVAGKWIWHADFRLHRDASVPILVEDVDGDGDNDLIWGRGHATGLYWLEQQRGSSGQSRSWELHAIDTSWSQAHTLLWGDLDGDGRGELVAGKRYLGHDGNDPGEWDRLCIYWYKFDSGQRAWRRHVISAAGQAGLDLDPKLVDLDGDGDLDLLAPGRSGLYWFENSSTAEVPAASESASCPAGVDHTRLMTFESDAGPSEQAVKTPADWARRREQVVGCVEQVMGPLPDSARRVPLEVKVLEETDTPHYARRKISYVSEPGDRVPAWLLVPKAEGRRPAMLCLHQTTKIGKDEPAGQGGLPNLHYAHELAERGFVCLVPDYPSFGEYAYDFAKSGYASGSMKAVWNNIRGLDLLESLAEVDPDRLGAIGHSLGGHNAIFTAFFDRRVRATISSCGFTGSHEYYGGKLAGWSSPRYMPRVASRYGNDPDRVPFDFCELLAGIAPRSFFSNSPVSDSNFDVQGVRKAAAEAKKVYELLGVPGKLTIEYPESQHDFPPAQRREAYDWLARQWKK